MGSISVPVAVAAGAEVSADAGAAAESAGIAASIAASTAGAATVDTAATSAATIASLANAPGALTFAAGVGDTSLLQIAGYASTAAGLVGSAGSAYAQHAAGVAQKNDAAMRARQAGLEAGQKQINIRQNMLKALASQNAAAGAAGIGTGGSFGSNVNRQITQNSNDLLALNADTSAEQSQYNAQGSNAVTSGNLKAGSSLLDAGVSAVKGFG